MPNFYEKLENILGSRNHKGDWYERILKSVENLTINGTGGGSSGKDGYNGWSPVFSLVNDEERCVLRIDDWIGGTGVKPVANKYISNSGFTSNITNAVDLRGIKGEASSETIITFNYNVGWQQVTAWEDNVVHTNDGVWLKMDGRQIDIEEYPDLIDTNAVTQIFNNKVTKNMTSDSLPTPQIASCSSIWSTTYPAYRAFCGINPSSGWASVAGSFVNSEGNQWVKIDVGEAVSINEYRLRGRGDNSNPFFEFPKEWVLEGSNDDESWDVIDSRLEEITSVAKYQAFDFILDSKYTYRYFRITVTKNYGGNHAHIGEIELQNSGIYAIKNIPLINGQYTYVKAKVDNVSN